jgi:hypothetical protein
MGDLARILSEKAPFHDYLLTTFVLAVFSTGVVALRGFQTAQLDLLASGVVLVPLAVLVDIYTQGKVFRSPASWGAMAFSVSLPIWLVEFTGLASSLKFSFYRQSSQTIFSTIIASTSKENQLLFDLILAPNIETFAGLAIGLTVYALFMKMFQYLGLPKNMASIPSSIFAAVPGALLLTRIHTTAGIEFQIIGFFVFYIMLAPVFVEDLLNASLWIKPFRTWIPITMGLGIGIHYAINGSQLGGFFFVLGQLWSNASQISWLYDLNVIWFAVTFLVALTYVWKNTGGRFISIRKLVWNGLVFLRSVLPI